MADEKYTDENAESDFNAGFTTPEKTAPLAVKTDEEKQAEEAAKGNVTDPPENKEDADKQDPPAEGGEGGEGGDPPPPADGADEVVTLKKTDFDRMMAAVDKVDGFDQKFNKVFGTTGSIQKTIKELQASTPKGFKVELPAEALAEMKAEYPEVAAHLEKVFGSLKGTGEVAAPAEDDKTDKVLKPDAVANIVAETVTRREMEVLEDEHPKWREIVGVVDADGKFDEKNPFRVWLNQQPADYKKKINDTNSPLVVSKAIDRFQAAQAEAARQRKNPPPKNDKQAASRKERIEEGTQPKGGNNPPPTKKSADDEFNDGFKSG